MAKLSHEIEFLAALASVSLARALPASLADHFGAALGRAAHGLLKSRRRIALDNLARALGDAVDQAESRRIVREVFRNTGRTLIDFARVGKTFRSAPEKMFVSKGIEQMKRVLDEGKGGVLVSGHFGSFELWGVWLAIQGMPMNFLTGVQHNPKVNRLLNGFRAELGVGIIPIDRGVRGVFRALKANQFVALLSDQHAPNGIVIDFFGRPAATPKGAATFAVRSGAPILPMVMRRERYDRHVIMAGKAIYPPNTGDNDADIRQMTMAYTSFFEECIRLYPEQWLWTHRRWKV